jgi:integrase
MQLINLTKKLIDATPHPSHGQSFLRDTKVPGLGVPLTKGSKSFIMEKRIEGQMRRWTLGSYGSLTLDEARKKAQEENGKISKGENPARDRKEKLHAATFGELAKLYLKNQAPRKKSIRHDQSMLNNHLAPWQNRKLASIKRVDVVMLHNHIGESARYAANRTVTLLRRMFNLAKMWGVFSGENPAKGIELFPEEKRERFVQPVEMHKLWKAIKEEPNVYIQSTFLLSLFTGARRGEILAMEWAHLTLDTQEPVWRIPMTKAGRAHTLTLAPPVVALLKSVPRLHGSPYVFPSHRGSGHLVNISKAWRRIRERAGLQDVRIHDLRRTVGSMLKAAGEDLTLIGKVLNHSQLSTTAIYARLNLDPVRKALDSHAEQVLELGTITRPVAVNGNKKKRPHEYQGKKVGEWHTGTKGEHQHV